MNTNTKSQPAAEQDKPQFLKLISSSASATLAMVFVGAGTSGSMRHGSNSSLHGRHKLHPGSRPGRHDRGEAGRTRLHQRRAGQCQVVRPNDGEGSHGINGEPEGVGREKGRDLARQPDAEHQAMVDKWQP